MQLVSNFAFSLKLTQQLPSFLTEVESVPSGTSWSKEDWSQWIWRVMRETNAVQSASV